MAVVLIYADGACKANGKANSRGGWAAKLIRGTHKKVVTGGEDGTTNNRMELMATIAGLEALTKSCDVEMHIDSKYVQNGITAWIKKWKKNGWRAATGAAVKNQDLWERLDTVASRHTIKWVWVRGHAENEGNNEVDKLAQEAAMENR
jgi:ribonuclease HI